jgi:hypothetical protein
VCLVTLLHFLDGRQTRLDSPLVVFQASQRQSEFAGANGSVIECLHSKRKKIERSMEYEKGSQKPSPSRHPSLTFVAALFVIFVMTFLSTFGREPKRTAQNQEETAQGRKTAGGSKVKSCISRRGPSRGPAAVAAQERHGSGGTLQSMLPTIVAPNVLLLAGNRRRGLHGWDSDTRDGSERKHAVVASRRGSNKPGGSDRIYNALSLLVSGDSCRC